VSDIDTVVVDSLKALDPKRPIREADIALYNRHVSKVPEADIASDLGLSSRQAARSLFTIQ
jgi:hypothetical protein